MHFDKIPNMVIKLCTLNKAQTDANKIVRNLTDNTIKL